ncbi:MAG TPA: VCBS repeat-containing protein [Polyangiaceae bacterium]
MILAGACSGQSETRSRSRGDGNGGSSGGATGGNAGTSTGGSAGTPACTREGAACGAGERCFPTLFEVEGPVSAGSTPNALRVGDVNNDDHLDAVVVDADLGVLSLLGSGDGRFAPGIASPPGHFIGDFELGNVDDDLLLDVVFPGETGIVLGGNGDGTFGGEVGLVSGTDAVSTGDLDADGALDIVVTNHFGGWALVLLGNGDGTFRVGEPFDVAVSPLDSLLDDVNDDRTLDLLVPDSQSVNVLLGNRDGTFGTERAYGTVGGDPWSLAVADLNGDGQRDIVTVNNFGSNASVFLGNGDGTFQDALVFATGYGPDSLVVLDADHDGKLDLAVGSATDGLYVVAVSIYPGNGDGTFGEPRRLDLGPLGENTTFAATRLAAGDFDEDGLTDIAALLVSGAELYLFRGTRFGTCEPE